MTMVKSTNGTPPAKVVKTTTRVSKRRRAQFLKYLARTGKVNFSAAKAGYSDSTFLQRLRKQDPEFALLWDEAVEAAADKLEDEALRRAVDGVDKPILYKGEIVAYEKEYSDQLLMFVLRGTRPAKYRDQNIQVGGTINHNHVVGPAIMPLTAPSMEDWQRAALDVHQGQKLLGPISDVDERGNVVEEQPIKIVRG